MNKGVYYLARAVCRQWVLDGKPKASKSQDDQWAKLMIMAVSYTHTKLPPKVNEYILVAHESFQKKAIR